MEMTMKSVCVRFVLLDIDYLILIRRFLPVSTHIASDPIKLTFVERG